MKRILLSILILSMSLFLFGDPVDENTAKHLAQNFWKENNIMGVKGDKIFKKKMDEARFVNVAPQCGYSEFYIFNNEDDKGFVIIAADDCVTPILGYSYDNNFDAENLPSNLKSWLDGYAEQIQAAVEMRATATEEIRADWECLRQGRSLPLRSETVVNPLLGNNQWGQKCYYNSLCPTNPNGPCYHTVTGCTGTAMAQIMHYWGYPEIGTGSTTYTPSGYPTQSVNFGETVYDWNNMPDSLNSTTQDTQVTAVAKLLWHCGVSLHAAYGLSTSAFPENVPNALQSYFNYSNDCYGENKNNNTVWLNKVRQCLNNGRPIHYSAWTLENKGHSFVCDGYDQNNYLHLNWGWNGRYNGYFPLTALNANNYQFNQTHYAIFDIHPKYTISVSANPNNGGSATGGGTYNQGASCTVHAVANSGYTFVNWTENSSQVSTDANYTFTVTGNRNLVANFLPQQYTINVSANPNNGGNATGGGTYNHGASCTVHAIANSGYTFVNWTENGTQVSTDANYTFTVTGNRNLVANFLPQQYTINVSANPNNGGNATGGGTYNHGASCTVRATANSGYTFVNWTENGAQVSTNADYTFTVTGNKSLVAHFQAQQQQYSISVTASPSNGGDVTGGGTYNQDASCTVHATANSGYTFVNWTENGTQVSTNANYTFTVTGNRSLVANFLPQQYTINVSAYPSDGGNVTGGGTYNQDASCTIHATANSGYTFVDWTENGAQVSTNADYTFTVTGDRSLVAHFQQQQYTISVSADPSNGGSVTSGGTFNQGASCTVHAMANSGYTFVNWTENGTQVSTNADYTFTVTGNRRLMAHFQQQQQQYTINVSANPSNGGSVTGGGTFDQDASCTVHATANSGNTFVNWTENGAQVSSNADYTFTVTGNRSLVAHFQAQQQQYSISVTASPSNGGNVTGEGTYDQGASCVVHATANSSYTFVNWTENGAQVSTNAEYAFTVTGNRRLVAHFQAQQQYTISVSADPSNGGSVTGGGTYNQGASCTVHATANSDFTFVNWTENGAQVSTNADYTFSITGSRSLVAHFQQNQQQYSIEVSADPSNGGSVTGGGSYNQGTSCTVHATANSGFTFVSWTENGTQVSINADYTFSVTGNRSLVAHFQQQQQEYSISVTASPSDGGSVRGGGTYSQGASCTVRATANNGFSFTNWTERGMQVSTNANYTFTVTNNRNLVANFAQNTHTIQASAGAKGIITPSGSITVAHGASQSFSMIPNSGYEVQELYIDGNPVGAMTSYTFTNVTTDHNIHVTFTHVDAVAEHDNNLINIYPNPTQGDVMVEGEGLSHVRIVNAYGQTVYNGDVEGDQVRIDLSQMAKGIYMMHIEADGGRAVRKIVVE
ncbi:MAG: C10 family peptidase [Bacteroidales bacterium]|nr:C10 family peptidase [Bacteroidales bacterium]